MYTISIMSTCHTSVEIPDEKIVENIETLYTRFLSLVEGMKDVIPREERQSKHEYIMYVARLSTILFQAQAYATNARVGQGVVSRIVSKLSPPSTVLFAMKALPYIQGYDVEMKMTVETLSRTLLDLTLADMQNRLPDGLKVYANVRGLKILVEVLLVKFGYDSLDVFPKKLQADFPGAVDEMSKCTLEKAVKANLESDQFKHIVEYLFFMLQELDTEEAQFICDAYIDWSEVKMASELAAELIVDLGERSSDIVRVVDCDGSDRYYDTRRDVFVERN